MLEETRIAAGPPQGRSLIQAGSATSKDWSGEVILINAHGFGPGAYTLATQLGGSALVFTYMGSAK